MGLVPQVRPSFGLTWGQCATTFPTQVSVQTMDANLGHQPLTRLQFTFNHDRRPVSTRNPSA